ncbi:MAG: FIST signal transduction protein, partial [Nitrospirales bacterium]
VRTDLGDQPPDLACLFFSAHYVDRAEELVTAVWETLQPGLLLGGSGEGVIAGSEEIEGNGAVTLWGSRLPGVTLSPVRVSVIDDGDQALASLDFPGEIASGAERPFFILLADPYTTPVPELLALMDTRYPRSLAIGGLVGGGTDLGENRVVLNHEVYEDGLVGCALSGPVEIRTIVSQGCRPIGDRSLVTKAERNVIHELSGGPALDQLQTAVESLDEEERRIAPRALHVGIAIDEQGERFDRGDFLVRNLIGADRETGSLAIGDSVKVGQTVQFHLRDARSASEDLQLLLTEDRIKHPKPPLGALMFSCCGRGRGLFGRPHHDVTVLRTRSGEFPVAGFFAQGEIGPVVGSNFLHGYTASIALFCEPDA